MSRAAAWMNYFAKQGWGRPILWVGCFCFSSHWLRAYSLPPKVVTLESSSYGRLEDLPVIPLQSLDTLVKEPLLSGGLWVDPVRPEILALRLPSVSSSTATPAGTVEWRLRPDRRALVLRKDPVLPSGLPAKLWAHSQGAGGFWAFPNRLAFRPEPGLDQDFWSVPLDAELVSLSWNARDSQLNAWSVYPPRLVVFRLATDRLFVIRWAVEGEPVAFLPCGGGRSLLVENLDSGMTRLLFFEGEKPGRRLEVDLSPHEQRSSVSAVRTVDCREIFLAGSFGLARLSL